MNVIQVFSPHFNERSLPINTLLIHYTDLPTTDEALSCLTRPDSRVSAHYLIDEKGKVYQLVSEEKRAWHAGKSYWRGCIDLNSCSIGIELSNPGHSHGYLPFPNEQIQSLVKLWTDIKSRWDIPSCRILGHSDVAPQRKQDPGHLFPWKALSQEGFGLWPDVLSPPPSPSLPDLMESLHAIGYEITSPQDTLLAFQRRFEPHKMDGLATLETLALAQGLLKAQEKFI